VYIYFTLAFNDIFSHQLINMTTRMFLYSLVDVTIHH